MKCWPFSYTAVLTTLLGEVVDDLLALCGDPLFFSKLFSGLAHGVRLRFLV